MKLFLILLRTVAANLLEIIVAVNLKSSCGLMFCGNCGRAMSYKTYKNNASEKQPPRYLCNNQSNCHTKSVKATDVINQIIGALECYIEDFKVELENDDGNSFNVRSQIISVLNKQLQDLEIREETQYEMLENKIYTPELFKNGGKSY